MLTAAALIPAMTHEAPEGGWVYYGNLPTNELPLNVPTFTKADAKAFPNCVTNKMWESVQWTNLLVVKNDASRASVSLEEQQERSNNDNAADDVWVIGVCV